MVSHPLQSVRGHLAGAVAHIVRQYVRGAVGIEGVHFLQASNHIKPIIKLAGLHTSAERVIDSVDKGTWAGETLTENDIIAVADELLKRVTGDNKGYNFMQSRARFLMGCSTGVRPGQGASLKLEHMFMETLYGVGPDMDNGGGAPMFNQVRDDGKENEHGHQEFAASIPHKRPLELESASGASDPRQTRVRPKFTESLAASGADRCSRHSHLFICLSFSKRS